MSDKSYIDGDEIPEDAIITQSGVVVTDGEGIIGYVNPTPEGEN
jgi:hypothetical protein